MTKVDGFIEWLHTREISGWSLLDKPENLPTGFPPLPLSITQDKLRRFRDDYAMLAEFAAMVCGVSTQELCAIDLIKFAARFTDGEGGE